jgi:hypothetical protein
MGGIFPFVSLFIFIYGKATTETFMADFIENNFHINKIKNANN